LPLKLIEEATRSIFSSCLKFEGNRRAKLEFATVVLKENANFDAAFRSKPEINIVQLDINEIKTRKIKIKVFQHFNKFRCFTVENEDFSHGLASDGSHKSCNIVKIVKNILYQLYSKKLWSDPESALRFCATFLKSMKNRYKILVDLNLRVLLDKKYMTLGSVILRAPGERSLSFPG